MKPETRLLVQSLQACQQRVDKLVYSLHKNAEQFPATAQTVSMWSEEQEESIDAFILRIKKISLKTRRTCVGAKTTDLQNAQRPRHLLIP